MGEMTVDSVWSSPLRADQVEDLEAWRADLELGRNVSFAVRGAFAWAEYEIGRERQAQSDRELAEGGYWAAPALEPDSEAAEWSQPEETGEEQREAMRQAWADADADWPGDVF